MMIADFQILGFLGVRNWNSHFCPKSKNIQKTCISKNPVKVEFSFFSNSEIRISQSPVAKYLVIEGSKVQSKSTIEEPIRMRVEKFEIACSVRVHSFSHRIRLLSKMIVLVYTDYNNVTWRHVSKINTFNGIIFREPEAVWEEDALEDNVQEVLLGD